MITLELDAEAEEEIAQAAEWYDDRGHRGLGARFVDAVGATFDAICERPESFPELLTERDVVVRRHLVGNFPYQVVFALRVDAAEAALRVLAVAHLRREPRYWLQRLP